MPKWNALSQRVLSGKARPSLGPQNGTQLPDGRRKGKRIPESASRVGCSFPMSASGKVYPEFTPKVGRTFPTTAQRKVHPGIDAQNGTQFPVGTKAESVSRNDASKWDAVSQPALFGKVHPGIQLESGMRFPNDRPTGKCIPESAPRMGCPFRLSLDRETLSHSQ